MSFRKARGMREVVAACALTTAISAPSLAQGATLESPVVSTQWLADHLNDPNLVVIHLAGMRRDYTNGHIPGARFLWFNDVAPSNPDLNTELPTVAKLDSLFESLGVSDNSRVVI